MRSIIDQLLQFKVLLGEQGRTAKRLSSKGLVRQFFEAVRLRIGPGKLSPEDYYLYRLYDDTAHSQSDKRHYISDRRLPNRVWARRHAVLADDKGVFYSFFNGLGFTIPTTFGYFHQWRTFGQGPVWRTFDEFLEYLSGSAVFPLIIKPVNGIYSRDVLAAQRFDTAAKELHLSNGETLSFVQLKDLLTRYATIGLVIQERLSPAPSIAKVVGDRLCTVRIIALTFPGGPRLYRAIWKIAGGSNMADNYWREGNCIAPVNMATGQIGPCLTGLGEQTRSIEHHPQTNKSLKEFVLPDWHEAKRLCLEAAASIPGIPMQAWDVALSDRGPMLLEVNIVGSLFLPQLAHGSGLLTPEFEEFLNATTGREDRH